MAEQKIDPEYTDYENDTPATKKRQVTGDSPCKNCPNEHKNKEICAEYCERLKAFQYNNPYRHLPYYPETPKSAQIANALPETPKTVTPATPKTTPWKRAMPIKIKLVQKPKPTIPAPMTYEEKMKIIRETDKCLNCGRPKSKYTLRMGLCVAKCSGAWRNGKIEHCLLGKWRKMSPEEVQIARYGEYSDCLIPGCTETGDRSELCKKHYKQWHDGRIEKPGAGKWFPKGQKKEGKVEDQVKYKISLKTTEELTSEVKQEELILHNILIDFTNYQEIYNELKAQVKLSKLPLAHVLFNLLSLGIMTAHEEEKRRNAEAK